MKDVSARLPRLHRDVTTTEFRRSRKTPSRKKRSTLACDFSARLPVVYETGPAARLFGLTRQGLKSPRFAKPSCASRGDVMRLDIPTVTTMERVSKDAFRIMQECNCPALARNWIG